MQRSGFRVTGVSQRLKMCLFSLTQDNLWASLPSLCSAHFLQDFDAGGHLATWTRRKAKVMVILP
jgi:hypothetical protein